MEKAMLNWEKMTSCWPNDEIETHEKINATTFLLFTISKNHF
jgi:hypothetical protein